MLLPLFAIANLLLPVFVLVNPTTATSLTMAKRNWCGYEHQCPCTPNKHTGCKLETDTCSGEKFWPDACGSRVDGKCGKCERTCVEFFTCNPPKPNGGEEEEMEQGEYVG
ncbi:hypothetical protein MKEN_00971500 [Mycena kentingensis (nom. inval.)]|nr:hypothetical protein MKEN_00971500 [Mycena kentingensis (nom. inval.)]